MANLMLFFLCLSFNIILFLPFPTSAISYCNGTCRTLNDCDGQLICINGKCDDDPDIGTNICGGPAPAPTYPISYCNGPCRTLNDCDGQLICINGKCFDDPDLGTHICPGTSSPSPSPSSSPADVCRPYLTLVCQGENHPTYTCSPPIMSSTPAKLTKYDFSRGGNGRGVSKCDKKYHDNSERIVALSTGWYNGGSRCGKMIRITASSGRSVLAKVVDECDSMNGCDKQHAYQPPCGNNVVDGSDAVWNSLGLDKDLGIVDVFWSMPRLEFMLICASV